MSATPACKESRVTSARPVHFGSVCSNIRVYGFWFTMQPYILVWTHEHFQPMLAKRPTH